MERISDSAGLELLQRANACLAKFFDRFSGESSAGPEELRELLQLHEALTSVGIMLDGGLNSTSQEIGATLELYRQNLMRLRGQLAEMRKSAIGRRERLDCQQEHLYGAKAWRLASRAIV